MLACPTSTVSCVADKPADLPVQAPTKFETRRPSQDSEGARRNDTAWPAFGRRRGDRIKGAMSAIGLKRTWTSALHMSAFGGKADMPCCAAYVCFWPKADIADP